MAEGNADKIRFLKVDDGKFIPRICTGFDSLKLCFIPHHQQLGCAIGIRICLQKTWSGNFNYGDGIRFTGYLGKQTCVQEKEQEEEPYLFHAKYALREERVSALVIV